MSVHNCDCSGWATKNNLKCSDGRIIRQNAFQPQDGRRVPLVWNHQHNSPDDVLGHADLENRPEGVYAYLTFNNTKKGQHAKECVKHGDVTNLSIWANNLQQNGSEVLHGVIREVSLVLAGANPGAFIESVVAHGEPIDEYDDEGIFYTNDDLFFEHAMDDKKEEDSNTNTKEGNSMAENTKAPAQSDDSGETIQDIVNTMNEKQKKAMYAIVGMAIEDTKKGGSDTADEDEEDTDMKHNIFDGDQPETQGNYLSHSDMNDILSDAKRIGSLRQAIKENLGDDVLIHAGIPNVPVEGMTQPTDEASSYGSDYGKYGFKNPSMFYPDARALTNTPEFIGRDTSWVRDVMSKVKHTPFSRVKSLYANITEDDARAKGYLKKGTQKKYEFFSTLKRVTNPTTIYKLQKLDRDDIIDITDFDVVAWIRGEMRTMLDEEIARAILIGDGREAGTEDKISEECIRPIAKDVDLFNVKVEVDFSTVSEDKAKQAKMVIDSIIRAHKQYRGSGNPTLYTTDDWLTEMLLLEDQIGHKLYKTEAELATALRVSKIVTVELMENQFVDGQTKKQPLIGIIVNLADYNVGQDPKGGTSMFDDFDIDFNQYKYLIETRMSGALVKPFSAITIHGKTEGE